MCDMYHLCFDVLLLIGPPDTPHGVWNPPQELLCGVLCDQFSHYSVLGGIFIVINIKVIQKLFV